MRTLVALICAFALSAAYCQTSPKTKPFTLDISAKPAQIESGMQVIITIRMKNLSDLEINCTQAPSNGVDKAYQYELWNAGGKRLRKKIRKHPEIRDEFSVRPPCVLNPGSTTISSAVINTMYDLTTPGRYTIQVSRPISDQDPESAMIYSNKITVTVTP